MTPEELIEAANETFPSFEQSTQIHLYHFMEFMNNVKKSVNIYKRIVAVLGVAITILHIYILSRKNMRKSSINVIMIGLAVCDIGIMCIAIVGWIQDLTNRTMLSCDSPLTYFETENLLIMMYFEHFCRRYTSWLAIMMATIRVIAVKNVGSRSSDYVSGTMCGLHTIATVFLLNIPFTICQSFVYSIVTEQENWLPPKNCPEGTSPPNTNATQYYIVEEEAISQVYIVLNGFIAKAIPCFAFPVLTGILIMELHKTEKIRKATIATRNAEKNDRTTALVTYIAISFCIAELPQGLLKFIEFCYYTEVGITYITTYATQIFVLVGFINALSHCVICYIMSIKYRSTCNNIFTCFRSIKSSAPKKGSTVSVTNIVVTNAGHT